MKKSAYLCHRLQYGSVSARGGRTLKMAKEVLQPSGRADKRSTYWKCLRNQAIAFERNILCPLRAAVL